MSKRCLEGPLVVRDGASTCSAPPHHERVDSHFPHLALADFGKTRLVYAERHDEIEFAIAREKLVKKWKRPWKFALIEADNPDWLDLWDVWFSEGKRKI